MGSSPCRRIPLLSIAHPVVGKLFQVLEAHQEMEMPEILWKRRPDCDLIVYFVKSWTVYPVYVYVKEKRCNETRFVLFNTVGNFFLVFMLPLL